MRPRVDPEAMHTRAVLEGALAEAEATFIAAATNLANGSAVPAETEADHTDAFSTLAKARASCLAARNALARVNIAEGKPIAYRYERRRGAHRAESGKATDRRKAIVDRRRSREALANRNRAELIVAGDKMMAGAVNDPNSGTTARSSNLDANSRSTRTNEHLVRAVRESATKQSWPQKESRRLTSWFTAQVANTKDTRACR